MEQTWYEKQFETAQLSLDDVSWLSQLADVPAENITDAWLEQANRYVSKGSIDLTENTDPETYTSVVAARQAFFGQSLGWDQPSHPLHTTYHQKWNNKNGVTCSCTTPLATSIATLRVLDEQHLRMVKIVKGLPAVLSYNPDSVTAKMANLRRLASALGWQGNLVDLIHYRPALLGDKPQKLRSLARFAADHGDPAWRQATNSEVATATIYPINSHLATIALNEYQLKNVKAEQKRRPANTRRAHSLELITDPASAARLGKKTIAAYLRYNPVQS